MKKRLLTLGTLFTLGVIGCGGGDDEAKELLQRILQLVGIPQEMVVTICQDSNHDGICAATELQTKLTVNPNDTVDTILTKLERLSEDTYFLDNYNPDYPILLILEDKARVTYNATGEFGLSFDSSTDGTSFDYNNTEIDKKELSILQSMIDADQLTKEDVAAARVMKDVDQFYNILLEDLAINVNTLGMRGLNPKQISDGNIKEMADELLINGIRDTIPNGMNACNGDQACIDSILAPLSKELLITPQEADQIVAEQTGEEENSNTETTTTTTKRDRVLTKESTYREDGVLEDTTTYQLDNNNRIIGYQEVRYLDEQGRSVSSTEDCSFTYTNNKLSEEVCQEHSENNEINTNRTVYRYEGERLVEVDSYENGSLTLQMVTSKWNDNTPTELVTTSYDANGQSYSLTTEFTYQDKNPVRLVLKNATYGDTVITKTYDDKKTPYDYQMIFGESIFWYAGVNNVIKEQSSQTYEGIESGTITNYNITYDGDYPVRVEESITSYYTGSEPYTQPLSTVTYEYKKLN